MIPTALSGRQVWRCEQRHPSPAFSKYVTSARGPFLNGTARTCPHHSTNSGACNPMNRASAWMAASAGCEWRSPHPRFSSNSFRNCRTRSADTSVDRQAIDRFAGTPGDSREQESQGVAVTPLGIPGEIPLADHVFHQEPANPRARARKCHA